MTNRLESPIGWTSPVTILDKIKCHALEDKSAYIDAQGRLSPCCWLGARQNNFVTDFNEIKRSWTSMTPNLTCQQTCSVNKNKTIFEDQWQRETQLR
jgi:hypothetical protein